jgi:hypothetical protein
MMNRNVERNFWRDLYPVSETRRRLRRASWLWIYLPIAASALVAAGIALALFGSQPGDGLEQSAQLATIILAGLLLAAGFVSWLILLASISGLADLLEKLPFYSSRMRLRFVIGARSWKRSVTGIKRTAAAIARFFSPSKGEGLNEWEKRLQESRRRGDRNG